MGGTLQPGTCGLGSGWSKLLRRCQPRCGLCYLLTRLGILLQLSSSQLLLTSFSLASTSKAFASIQKVLQHHFLSASVQLCQFSASFQRESSLLHTKLLAFSCKPIHTLVWSYIPFVWHWKDISSFLLASTTDSTTALSNKDLPALSHDELLLNTCRGWHWQLIFYIAPPHLYIDIVYRYSI